MNKKTALVVIDFQNDFVNGSLGFEKATALEDIICEKIEKHRKVGNEIIFTFDTHFGNYLETNEGKNLPVKHCILGSEGHKLYGKVRDYFNDQSVYFQKETFGSMKLANYLKDNNFEIIELVGLVSNICVLTNAVLIKTAIPEAEIIVDSQSTASFDEELNKSALRVLEGIHIKVV